MGINDIWLFLLAGFLLNITPGPDMALIIGRSSAQGTRAGVVAALGVGAGAFIHIAAAAIGLSALILTSAIAFTALKWAGAIYLVWLGVQMLRATLAEPEVRRVARRSDAWAPGSLRRIFLQGVLTNALNPKVAVFFLAFLPQFVDADAPSKAAAFAALGLIFNVVGTLWNIAVACLSGSLAGSDAFKSSRVWLERGVGAIFIAVGMRMPLADIAR